MFDFQLRGGAYRLLTPHAGESARGPEEGEDRFRADIRSVVFEAGNELRPTDEDRVLYPAPHQGKFRPQRAAHHHFGSVDREEFFPGSSIARRISL
jgi:hypothetical protein